MIVNAPLIETESTSMQRTEMQTRCEHHLRRMVHKETNSLAWRRIVRVHARDVTGCDNDRGCTLLRTPSTTPSSLIALASSSTWKKKGAVGERASSSVDGLQQQHWCFQQQHKQQHRQQHATQMVRSVRRAERMRMYLVVSAPSLVST
mmetsp:Transcript_7477/g.13879  ORF Transcript_7477/g.13879 Transcript_7477/m.13879 type:complete len:148 (+) Transcript_7477:72-515(+)